MIRERLTVFLLFSILPLLVTGCGTLKDGRSWGQDALVPVPTWERIGRSALRAVLNPMTWVPAVGAGVFAIDHFDRKVSDWAYEKNPIFGSPSTAGDSSDYLLWTTFGTGAISTIATPGGEEPGDWMLWKAKGLVVEGIGVGATAGVTGILKEAVQRPRPTGSSNASFPSGHASAAFSFATMTSKNLDSIAMPSGVRIGLQTGAYTVAAGTAWARVEAGKHYPSDILAGAAIGHFLTAFIQDAFLGLPLDGPVNLEVEPVDHGATLSVGISF